MRIDYNFRTVVGLVIRAIGLVAMVMGAGLLGHWLLWELGGGSRSFSFRPFAVLGFAISFFGIICRRIASRIIRTASR